MWKEGNTFENAKIFLLYVLKFCLSFLIKTTFNWGWLIGSEVQFIVIKEGTWQHPGGHGAEGCFLK